MKKSWAWLLVTVLLAGVLHTGVAWAEEQEVAFGRWWRRPALAKALELEDATVQALDALYLERKTKLIDLKAALQKERTQLKVMLDQIDLDRAEVMQVYEAISDLRARLGRERMEYFLDVRGIIGPQRFIWLKNYYQERRQRLRETYQREKERQQAQEDGAAAD